MLALSKKKRWSSKGKVLYSIFLIFFVLGIGEIAVRALGFSPWSLARYTFESEPFGPFFEPDARLGYKGRPGVFRLILSDTLRVVVSHDLRGYRITSTFPDPKPDRPEIWVFGCSFTHGFGVNDYETYPWMLQEAFPSHKVSNFGMDGYGTYHALLQLESLMADGDIPELVILAYGSFHNQRNVSSRYWKKALAGRDVAEGIQYPFVRFNASQELIRGMEKPVYKPWPLMRHSALVHYLENTVNNSEYTSLKPFEVTKRVIQRIDAKVSEYGSELLVLNIFRDKESTRMLDSIGGSIKTLDISVDLNDKSVRILPGDGHPNRHGHRQMADELIKYLNTQNLHHSVYSIDQLKP